MTKLPIVLALALFATTAPSTAAVLLTLERLHRSSPPTVGAAGRSIDVSGEAVINVVPDLATMTFRVERKGATREAALQSVDDGVAAVLQALREQGAAPADQGQPQGRSQRPGDQNAGRVGTYPDIR